MRRPLYHDLMGHKGAPELCLDCRLSPEPDVDELEERARYEATKLRHQQAIEAHYGVPPDPARQEPEPPAAMGLEEADKAWGAWQAKDHLFSKRTLFAKQPTTARAVFIDGYLAALAENTTKDRADDDARFALTVRGWAASSGAGWPEQHWIGGQKSMRGRAAAKGHGWDEPQNPVEQHAFSRAAEPVLQRALELVTERGGTHGDTWRLPMVTAFLDHVLALHSIVIDDPEWKRLLIDAVFVDMKDARFARGEWKVDDIEDGVNYRAGFAGWRSEYDHD